MSRSNPTADPIMNPSKRWFQWDSTTKGFKFYDKEATNTKDASKKGANIMVPLPFKFIVLDVLTTVAGFSDAEQSSFYSNEVRNYMGSTKVEVLDVKLKGKTVLKGTWEAISKQAEAMDAKFANSVYIAYFDENKELQIGNIKLYGAPIGAWIEITNTVTKAGKKIAECAFKVVSTKPGKKGSVTWNEPVFELIEVKAETNDKATALDIQLQDFLKEYLAKKGESTPQAEGAVNAEDADAITKMENNMEEETSTAGAAIEDEDF